MGMVYRLNSTPPVTCFSFVDNGGRVAEEKHLQMLSNLNKNENDFPVVCVFLYLFNSFISEKGDDPLCLENFLLTKPNIYAN